MEYNNLTWQKAIKSYYKLRVLNIRGKYRQNNYSVRITKQIL